MIHKLTGETLGHYRMLQPIERGGMASVFLARDIHLQREVAIKVFQPQGDQERASTFFRRFTREAQIVARLDHPNILQVYDYGEQDGLAYLVMPYLSRGSLKHLLTVRGHLPIADALRFIFQLLDALQYAHDQGLIHRDIKPGNILFKNDQTVMLADFGLVKEITNGAAPDAETGEEPTAGRQPTLSSSFVMGTPYYMAPEQIRGRVQPASDVYSLGLVLYEMLTGQRPYVMEPGAEKMSIFLKQLTEPPRPIRELNPDISPQLARVIMHALEKDATQRYQRPHDFSQALQAAVQQLDLTLPSADQTIHRNVSILNSDPAATVAIPSELPSSSSEADQSTSLLDEDSEKASTIADSVTMSLSDPLAHQSQLNSLLAAPRDADRLHRRRRLLYATLAAIVLAALSFGGLARFIIPSLATTPTHMSANKANRQSATTKVPSMTAQQATTRPLSTTQTSCPGDGKARKPVMDPYTSQGHNVVVYSSELADSNAGTISSTLMRYDVATGKASPIVTISSSINNAQLSEDGQWVIFITKLPWLNSFVSAIQIVRIDGQELQTLYCSSLDIQPISTLTISPGINTASWYLFFSEERNDNNNSTVFSNLYMLDMVSGDLIGSYSITGHSYKPLRWINAGDIYLFDQGNPNQSSTGTQYGDLIDLSINHASPASLTLSTSVSRIPTSDSKGNCFDFSMSPDLNNIFTSQCKGVYNPSGAGGPPSAGPSTIDRMQQVAGGGWSKATTIFKNSTLAIAKIQAITPSMLLLQVGNEDQYHNQNGLWKVNTDGTGLQSLAIPNNTSIRTFGASKDGTMYFFETGDLQAVGHEELSIGSTSGGQPTSIAQAGVGGLDSNAMLGFVGWAAF